MDDEEMPQPDVSFWGALLLNPSSCYIVQSEPDAALRPASRLRLLLPRTRADTRGALRRRAASELTPRSL